MTKKEVPSLTDKAWANENELGTIEEVIEYTSGEERKEVYAVAHILSGAEGKAIEAEFTTTDYKTGEIDMDGEGIERAKWKRIFRIDDAQLDSILNNKSSDLRTKMMILAGRACGYAITEEEQEHEKNSDCPVS